MPSTTVSILQALNAAARGLLRGGASPWTGDPSLVQLVGALGAERMSLIEYVAADREACRARLAHTWGARSGSHPRGLEAAAAAWESRLRAGGVVTGSVGGAAIGAAPVFAGGSCWGCLLIASAADGNWSAAQLDALEAAAGMIGAAIGQHRSHADLRLARERLQFLADSSPVAMFACDPRDFALTWASDNIEALFGIPAGWLVGQPPADWECIHPDDRAAVMACTRDLTGERPNAAQFRYRHAGGEIRWGRLEIRQMAAGGKPEVVGCLVDTSETMRALQSLQGREAILNAVSFMAERFLYGQEWVDAIPAALERLGQAAQADEVLLIQKVANGGTAQVKLVEAWTATGNACCNAVFPQGVNTAPVPALEIWERRLGRGEAIAGCVSEMSAFEQAILRPEGVQAVAIIPIFVGQSHWGQIAFSRGLDEAWPSATLDGLRAAAGIFGAAIQNRRAQHELERRVAERTAELALANRALQESGQLYRTLVETSPDGILVSSPDRRITMVNPSGRSMFHWDSPEEPISAIEAELLKHGNPRAAELTLTRPDGTSFKADVTSSTVPGAAGQPRYMIRVVRDITERKQLEEQFRQAQKMEAIGRLAGGIAHDFNNLLTVMKGYGELLLKRLAADAPNSRKVAQIVKAAERAAALVEQLLAFSRKQMVEPRILELNAALAETEKMLRRLIGEDIEFATHLDPAAGRIRVDPAQLDQMVMNLTVNARDAMQSGGVLTICTHAVRVAPGADPPCPGMPPGAYAAIEVRDTGAGMTEEVRMRIFEPFFTTKEVGKGTGLGLSTVYGIVQQTGGFIAVDTAPGAGTAFRIYLPSVAAQAGSAAAQLPAAGRASGQETILVAEDEDDVRAMVVETLEESGYTVVQAPHGRAALDAAAQWGAPIQMLLTDVVMPRIGGPELWNLLAPRFPGMRLLYITGYADRELEPEAPFLKKPFSPDALTRRVRDILDAK